MTQPRTPAGSPDGGQFGPISGAESATHLDAPVATIGNIADGRETLASDPTDVATRDWLLDAETTLASDMGTSVSELSILASSQFWVVRDAVAKHPATGDATLLALADDVSPDVRSGVARNPNTPQAAIAILVDDAVPYVGASARLNQRQD